MIKQIKHLRLRGLVFFVMKPGYKMNLSFWYLAQIALWFPTYGALVHVNKIVPLSRTHSSQPSVLFAVTWKVQREQCHKNGFTSIFVDGWNLHHTNLKSVNFLQVHYYRRNSNTEFCFIAISFGKLWKIRGEMNWEHLFSWCEIIN